MADKSHNSKEPDTRTASAGGPIDAADGVRVGDSPVPGLTLQRILRGHQAEITRIAWSPDGRLLATASGDGTNAIWDSESGRRLVVLEQHAEVATGVAWSPDGTRLASCSRTESVLVWDVNTWTRVLVLNAEGAPIERVLWSPDGKRLVGRGEAMTLHVWDVESGRHESVPLGHYITEGMAWSPDGQMLAVGSWRGPHLCDGNLLSIEQLEAPDVKTVRDVTWTSDGHLLAVTGYYNAIALWSVDTRQLLHSLEGHTNSIKGISFSHDDGLLVSKSNDQTVRIWRTDTWTTVAVLGEGTTGLDGGVACHPRDDAIATLGDNGLVVRLWRVDRNLLLRKSTSDAVRYTTAKLVLVGDSGVGKTALGWRLAHGTFKEQASTHGQQFWVIDKLGTIRADGTECEAVLWDLAGQPDYRVVHSVFLNNLDVALVLFDPTNRQEPLAGVDFWLNQLKRDGQWLCRSVLIGSRTDRGTPTLTADELRAYCERHAVSGGYIATSALSGEGLAELQDALTAQVPWDTKAATVTTLTFKRIKEYVLGLKEHVTQQNVLLTPEELAQALRADEAGDWDFGDDEMMAAVGHLANHGYVALLRGSQGSQFILLTPDLLPNLASSFVLEARRNPRGLGVLEESRVLAGDYQFPELTELTLSQRQILSDAAALLFLEHNVCFRETFNQQAFLVFPSLINEKRPKDTATPLVEGASYRVRGAVENVYASLVVLLGYTNTFIRTNQWQNQAQYEMGEGEICGFQQIDSGSGEIELVLYYAADTPSPVRTTFLGLFERFLSRRHLEVSRYEPVECSDCGALQARNVVSAQLDKGKRTIFCHECGCKIELRSPEPLTRLSKREERAVDLQQEVARRRTAFEAAIVRIKALLRDRRQEIPPTCFISYAWGVSEHERWVLQLAKDLRNAGVDVLLDRWESPPGSNLDLYIDRILSCACVVPVGTPELRQKYDSRSTDPVLAAELKLINLRVRQASQYGETIIPALLVGEARTSLSPQLQALVAVDFREAAVYFQKLLDMIWRIHNLPFDHPVLEVLRESLSSNRS